MLDVLDLPANAHSTHRAGQHAFSLVEGARRRFADLLGVRPDRVIFTSGATESNALALAPHTTGVPEPLVSAVEHPSVLAWGAPDRIPVTSDGVVRLDVLADRYWVDTQRASTAAVMLANNETGVIQPIAEVLRLARERGVRVHVDATQGIGRMTLPPELAAAASVAYSAHKFGGPQGVGALIVADGGPIPARARGGPQERGRRAGTLNVAGIVGMVAAAEVAKGAWAGLGALRDRLEADVVGLGATVVGGKVDRLANTVCAVFLGWEAQDLVIALDLSGVEVSAGAACASGSPERSHVLRAMGVAGSAVRFSLSFATTEAEVTGTIDVLRTLCRAGTHDR